MTSGTFKYKWFSTGDYAASATIIFDNLTVLTFMALILQFGYQFPNEIIMTHIIPGTVFGVLLGNLLFIWLGFRLAKKEKRDVIALPFGLDAPSAIGYVVCIIGPAYQMYLAHGQSTTDAGINAWQVGVGSLFFTGLIKLIFSFFAESLKKLIPPVALLGAIGGVAIALIGFFPLISIFKVPTVGLVALTIILLTMFAKVRLPFNISGVPASIIIGTLVFYLLIPFNLSGTMPSLTTNIGFLLPLPHVGFFADMSDILGYLPIVVPFSLLVIFGTMSVVEGASCLGEKYNIREIMLVDGVATVAASLFGGIGQTTPYAGFPAYQKMGARSGFLFLNVIVVGIGGLFGLVGLIVNLIPESAVAPVLLYVAFEIAMQGFIECDKKLTPVILFSFFPSIARLLQIKITDGSLMAVDKIQAANFASSIPTINEHLVIVLLGNGFIITGILWASLLYFAMMHKRVEVFVTSIILAVSSYFGIIHSLYVSGQLYFPSQLPEAVRNIPIEIALGYLFFGVLAALLCKAKERNN